MMGFAPDSFWRISTREWVAALDGFREFHGGAKQEGPMSREAFNELARRYPDDASK